MSPTDMAFEEAESLIDRAIQIYRERDVENYREAEEKISEAKQIMKEYFK